MKRLLILLVILALAGYLTFKAGVWWLVDQRLSEANSMINDIGVISPGKIRSGIAGSLTFADGEYKDFRLSQPLTVGRLFFDAGSPVALINALLDPAVLPPRWTLRGEQLSMPLGEGLFSNWVTASDNGRAPILFAPVCGPDHRQQLGSGDLFRLGINGLEGETLVRQDASGLYAEITTAEIGSVEVVWPGARFNPLEPLAVLTSSAEPMTVNLRDGGLMRRISAYCSREAGLETDQWTRVVMESFRAALAARGFEPSGQLIALYRQWLSEGGELSIELSPGQSLWGVPMGPAEPFILYNGAQVPDVYLTSVEPEPEAVPAEAMEPIVDSVGREGGPGWQTANIEDAAAMTGQTVRVTLANGNRVEGRMAGIVDERMEVVRLVDGGEVAYPIAMRLIDTFEVWRRDQNP